MTRGLTFYLSRCIIHASLTQVTYPQWFTFIQTHTTTRSRVIHVHADVQCAEVHEHVHVMCSYTSQVFFEQQYISNSA